MVWICVLVGWALCTGAERENSKGAGVQSPKPVQTTKAELTERKEAEQPKWPKQYLRRLGLAGKKKGSGSAWPTSR